MSARRSLLTRAPGRGTLLPWMSRRSPPSVRSMTNVTAEKSFRALMPDLHQPTSTITNLAPATAPSAKLNEKRTSLKIVMPWGGPSDDILEGTFDIGLTDQELVRVATARALHLEFFRPSPAETLRIDLNARWCLLACLRAGVEQRSHLTLHSKLPSPELVWRRQEVLAVQYCSPAERSMTVFTRHSLVPDSSCYGLTARRRQYRGRGLPTRLGLHCHKARGEAPAGGSNVAEMRSHIWRARPLQVRDNLTR